MIGAVIFVIFFVVFLAVSLGMPTLPPGSLIHEFLGIPETGYLVLGIEASLLINAIVNGVFYGFIVWLVYSLIALATGRGKKKEEQSIQQTVSVQVQEKAAREKKQEAEDSEIAAGLIPIKKIEGIGSGYAEKLASEGILTSADLLEAGRLRNGRTKLAEKTGISSKLILEWVNLADLVRVKGVSEEYSDLLEEAGVDTVAELAIRNPENLCAKMKEANEKKHLVRRTPSISMVTDWISQAKKLPRLIEY
jgi:predicted flap endonuclease-1-like 5' DNA nuclease